MRGKAQKAHAGKEEGQRGEAKPRSRCLPSAPLLSFEPFDGHDRMAAGAAAAVGEKSKGATHDIMSEGESEG